MRNGPLPARGVDGPTRDRRREGSVLFQPAAGPMSFVINFVLRKRASCRVVEVKIWFRIITAGWHLARAAASGTRQSG